MPPPPPPPPQAVGKQSTQDQHAQDTNKFNTTTLEVRCAGKLAGMPVTFFTSTGTQGGGQEETILTSLTQAVHHGMIYIPPGYTLGSAMFDVSEVRGGSPYGAGTFAGADGSRMPSAAELAYAGAVAFGSTAQ